MTKTSPITVGDLAPHVELKDQHGRVRTLSEFLGRPLVVYFYPKNNTPVCTAEACSFRDEFDAFRDMQANVVGISADSVESHAAFARARSLPFVLLSDPDGQARAAFGVPKLLGMFPGRVTYVIDHSGRVVQVVNAAFSAKRHVRDAVKAIRKASPGASTTAGA